MTAVQPLEKPGGRASNPWKPYPAYKPSGVEWLGDVPKHWGLRKHSRLFQSAMGQTILREDVSDVGKVPVLSATEEYEIFGYLDSARVLLNAGDLVIPARGNSIGHVKLVHETCTTTQTTIYSRHLTNLVDSHFAFFFLLGNRESLFYFDQTAIPQLTVGQVSANPFLLPPVPEQRAIADFLDRETEKIDRLVAKKRELIEKLKEERAALISRTVTRGLNPEAKMKPSGVEWMGDVPEGWEVKPVKFIARIGNGSTPSRENAAYWEEGTYPWLNSSVVNQESVTEAEDYVTPLALSECHLPRIKPPVVLIGITGQGRTRGMASTLLIESTINQHIAYLKPFPKRADVGYLRRVFDRAYSFLRNESDGEGSTKGAITCKQLGSLPVPVPPLPEQRAIANYLDRETGKIDRLAAKVEEAIARLQEYRAALITAAVTGKIDVRGEASADMSKRGASGAVVYPGTVSELPMAAEAHVDYRGN